MTEFEATGGCLCGEVRFQNTAKPLATSYCHCTMCQKNGGRDKTARAQTA